MNLVFSKKIVAVVSGVFLFAVNPAFSQSSQKSDGTTSPSISMPEMPSVSMPSVGSGFYTPGRSDFYNPNLNRNRNSQSAQSQSQTSGADSQNQSSSTASSSQEKALAQAQKAGAIAQNASSALNGLTADDISSMNNLGIFSQISGLLGRGNSNLQNQLLSAQKTVTANTVDSMTLKQILSELTELKNQMNNSGEKSENASLSDKSAGENTFSNITKKEPKILRFIVNGYDILSTCKKIYFSELETDGTFLLTGDRKYLSENKARNETFYFYFHAQGTDKGITKYAVTPAVSQDYENQYSYLYQLTQKNSLTADRTGNLVTLRVNEGGWNMDLLISLDK
ncbi:MAG: hypothetical protein J6N81_00745 [Treponema sp.]|nr:hypothetical protein [Treponema sp.]